VNLYAGAGADQVNVASTRAGSTVNIFTDDGDDAVYLGVGDFGALKGTVNVVGGNGADDAVIVPDYNADSDSYTLDSMYISRDGAATSSY
jgi:hypothetical protein